MKALYVIWDVLKMMGSGVVNLFDLVMEAKKLQQEMEAQRERQRQEKEKQKQAYIELSDELDRKKDVRKKFKTISAKLQELIDTGERKVKKNSDLK